MRLFLDTNVLIDYFGRRKPFMEGLIQLRIMQLMGDVELWASAKSFTDIFYILRGQVDGDKLQMAFGECLSFLRICSIDGKDIAECSQRGWADFEDCLIDRAAQKVRADMILTRDAKGFEKSSIPRKSVAEFIRWMDKEWDISYDAVPAVTNLDEL